jgi:plastocyanin
VRRGTRADGASGLRAAVAKDVHRCRPRRDGRAVRLADELRDYDLTAAETNVRIEVRGTGYIPNSFTVPAGEPVTMTLATSGALGCTSVFRIPKLKIERTLQTEQNNVIVATFPTAGLYTFSCGMGMYTGTITAI